MGWPEITLMALWTIGFGIRVAKHGQPVTEPDGSPGKYHLGHYTFRMAVWTWLLWAGGFFQ